MPSAAPTRPFVLLFFAESLNVRYAMTQQAHMLRWYMLQNQFQDDSAVQMNNSPTLTVE